jgi:hypothetical protein
MIILRKLFGQHQNTASEGSQKISFRGFCDIKKNSYTPTPQARFTTYINQAGKTEIRYLNTQKEVNILKKSHDTNVISAILETKYFETEYFIRNKDVSEYNSPCTDTEQKIIVDEPIEIQKEFQHGSHITKDTALK